MKLPVIFFSFANRAEDPFLDLSQEDDQINDLFLEAQLRDDNNGFQLQRFSRITSTSLIKYLQAFDDQISIFHYAGHAGNSQLYLSDQGARSKGLAALLGKQTNLQLVFLNGCHTKELVDDLLAKNVPVVIATDREVADDTAIKLAKDFYAGITGGNSIRTSFENAVIGMQVTDGREIKLRNVGRRSSKPKTTDNSVPWGLYYKDAKALNWRLSQSMSDIQNTTDHFWVRMFVLFAAIFIFYSWMNRHLGVNSTAFFLSTGPMALLGIGLFLLNTFKNVSPAISNLSKKASYLFLKTPMLIGIGLFVATIISFGSSVEVTHEGQKAIDFTIKDTLDQHLWQWPITSDKEEKSRKLIIASPFQSKKVLEIDGYQPEHFNLPPFVGSRLNTANFDAKAGLLIRLMPNDIPMIARIKLYIELPTGETLKIDPVNKGSALIGPKPDFSETQIEAWKTEARSWGLPDNFVAQLVDKWKDPNNKIIDKNFEGGDKIKISKIIGDSVSLIKEVTIENKKLNDVLLQKED